MAAYVIAIHRSTKDENALRTYADKVGATLASRNVTFPVRNGRLKRLEGSASEGVVIVQFPTFEDAEAWYESPTYQEIIKYRQSGAEFDLYIVEGAES